MTIGIIARVLVSLVALVTIFGGLLADFLIPATARQHIYNPQWPPHAKFHNGQTITLGILLGPLALWLIWFSGSDLGYFFHLGVIVASLYWISMLGAILFPGTQWTDPAFETVPAKFPVQMRLIVVLLTILLISEALMLSVRV